MAVCRQRRVLRFLIAVVAAYALAMQGLLGGIITAKAAAAPFAICLSDDSDAPADHGGGNTFSKHQHCVLCTFAKNANALLAPDRTDVSVGRIASDAPLFKPRDRVVRAFFLTGHSQRGPPPRSDA